jgi:hypothetical protein
MGVMKISTAEELMLVGDRKHRFEFYKLVKDIDLSGIDFKPINHLYECVFDGNGKTIRGLKITSQESEKIGYYGLFSVAASCEIKNLTLSEPVIEGGALGICGAIAGATDILPYQDKDANGIFNCKVVGGRITGFICGGGVGMLKSPAPGLKVFKTVLSGGYIMGGLAGIAGVGWKYKNPMDRMLKGASAKVTLQPGENCYKAGQMWGLDMDLRGMSAYANQV